MSLAVDRRAVLRIVGGPAAAGPTCQILPPNFPGIRSATARTVRPGSPRRGARARVGHARDARDRVDRPHVPARDALRRISCCARWVPGEPPCSRPAISAAIYDPRAHVQAGPTYWGADYAAPSDFLAKNLSCAAFSRAPRPQQQPQRVLQPDASTRTCAVPRARRRPTPTRANRLWAAVDRELVDAAPWVPLYNPRGLEVLSKRVGNYQFNPVYGSLIDQLWVR